MYMCNVFKKYGKIIFLFMIMFIGSFFSIEKVEAAGCNLGANIPHHMFNWNRVNLLGDCAEYELTSDVSVDRKDLAIGANSNNYGTTYIDLKGHRLEIMDKILIEDSIKVVIYDSVGGGVIENTRGGESTDTVGLFEITAGSSLEIRGGTIRNHRTIGPIVKMFPSSSNSCSFTMTGGRIERKYSDLSSVSTSVQNSKRAPIPIIASAGSNSTNSSIHLKGGTVYDELTNGITAGGMNNSELANASYIYIESPFSTNTTNLVKYTTNNSKFDKFYITYYDGTTSLKEETYTYGKDKTLSYTPTKSGYVFAGWYTDSELTNKITSISSSTEGDINLYAKWTKTYTITYYNGDTKVKTQTYTPGTKQSLYEYSKTGYTFGGWYTDTKYTTKVTEISASTTGDKTYYAKMTANSYNINYYNGSTKITGLTPSTYTYGSGATLPSYSKTGYVFGGWYTDTNYTTKVTSVSTSATGDKTYYMKLTNASYSISYYDENSKLVNDLTPTSYTYGSGATLPTYTCPTGYKFVEWTNSSGTAISSISTSDTGNYSLYATCERNEYNIIYELNGGTNNDNNPKSYLLGSAWTLINGNTSSDSSVSLYNPTKTGYTFQGWYDNSDFTGTKLTSVDNSTAEDRTVYAKYTPNMYTVTLDDTLGGIKVTKAVFDSAMPDVTIPIRTGYDFAGYYSSSDVKYYDENGKSAKNYDIASNSTLFAKWTPKKYDITWIDGNGKTIYVDKVDYDSIPKYNIAYYGKPKKDMDKENGIAYMFKGWDSEVSIVTGDATYNATFEEASKFNINYYYGEVKLEGLEPSIYKVGEDTTLPTEIEGFTLDGWYLEKYFKTKITTISADSEGDINVYAKPEDIYNNEYLEDNLILHLDGINHGSVSDVWQDLSKNHNDVHLSENQIFEKNNLQTNKLVMNDSVAISENNIFENEPEEFTIEIVSEYYDDNTSIVAAIRDASDLGISGLDFIGYSDKQAVRLLYPSDGNSLLSQYNFEKKTNEKVYRTITFNKTDNKMKVYESGTLVATVDVANGTAVSGKKLQLGGLSFAENYGLNGAIYSVRIYDKELTQDEVGQNYMVDSERFSKEVDYEKENLIIHLDGTNPGNTDGIWQDLSGNGNHGTINGATKTNNGYKFDGINDYISFAKSHSYENLTLETIVSSSNVGTIIANFETGGYGLQIDDTNIIAKSYIDNDYSTLTKNKNDINDIVHLAYTIDSNYQKLYIDGSLVASKKVEGTIKNLEEENIFLTLGANPDSDGYSEYFSGSIYSLKLYSKVLNDSEVKQNYELDKTKYNMTTSDYITNNIILHLDGKNTGNEEGIWKDLSKNKNDIILSETSKMTNNGLENTKIGTEAYSKSKNNVFNSEPETFTIEVVGKFNSNQNGALLAIRDNSEFSGLEFDQHSSKQRFLAVSNVNKQAPSVAYEYESKYNEIVYRTVTYNRANKTVKIYENGVYKDTMDCPEDILVSNQKLYIASIAGFPEMNLDGNVYAVRIYDDELSSGEIKQNYEVDKTKYENETNLVLHLDGTNPGNTDGIWQDLSKNKNDIILSETSKMTNNGLENTKIGTEAYSKSKNNVFNSEPETFTIEVVGKFNSNQNGALLAIRDNSEFSGLEFDQHSSKQRFLAVSNVNKQAPSVAYEYESKYNEIVYRTVTYNRANKTVKIYENGVYKDTMDCPEDILVSNQKLYIASIAEKPGMNLDGSVYAIKIYNEELDSEQIEQNYIADKIKYENETDLILHLDGTNKGDTEGVWQDISGNENHATINGATQNGNGYKFDGVDDFGKITSLNEPEYITVEAVINPNEVANERKVLSVTEDGGFSLVNNNTDVGSNIYVENIGYSALFNPINFNKISKVTYTYDGTMQKLYIDGKLVNQKEIAGKILYKNEDYPLIIGAEYITGYDNNVEPNSYFDGTIYDIKIYNRALTAAEVKQNYEIDKAKYSNSFNIEYYNGTVKLEGIEPSSYEQGIGTELVETELEGYTFNGWYTSSTFEEDTKKENISTSDTGNMKLYAKFDTNQYTITFEENGGSEVEDITADYASEVELPTPTKENFVFGGWYTDETLETEATNIVPSSDVTYYAKWIGEKYNITYYNGETELTGLTNEYMYGEGLILPTEVEGYEFAGWYTDAELTEESKVTEILPTETGDKVFYAKVIIQEYTISFETNGGTEIAPITGEYGTEVVKPVDPTKEHYTFEGWYSDETLETKYEITTIPGEDITLYANWTADKHKITWLNSDGTEIYIGDVDYGTLPVYDEETYGLPVSPEEVDGYEFVFKGWDKELVEVTEDTTYTAVYEQKPLEYNITYYVGGVVLSSLTPNTYVYGVGTELAELDLTGYTLEGWYTSPLFEEETKVEKITETDLGDKVLYAKLSNTVYTLTFEENGGSEVEDITAEFETPITAPTEPTKEGHTFVGWFDDETLTNEFEFTTMPGVDMTLYAKWEANKYTIEYYNGDIKLELMPNEYTYGIETPLPTEIEGYDFTGWYLDKDLTSEVQTAISATDTENKVFYTSTTIGTYTITFEENGGSEIEDITAEFETPITKPVDPTKVGNTFDGWYIDAEFTTPFEFTTMPGKDTTLYAKWVPEKYTITWSNPDGIEIYSEELDYGTLPKYNEETYGLPTYEKEGYTTTFTSWDSEIVEVTENKTYTAIYDEVANTYTITYYDGEDMLYLEPSEYVYGIGTELPTYQRDDLVVENWYTSPTFEEETKVEKITESDLNDKVLYAKMEKIKYTISFEENGGTEVQDIKGEFGTDVTAPQAPTKDNYTFDNWYIDAEFTTPYEFTTMPEENITLYAKWNANEYAINYYNGAIKLEGLEPSKHVYGEKTTLPTEVEGYTFEGWFSTPTFDEGTQVTEISETTNAEITVYAKMSINTYTITFEENGGSEVEDITGEYGNVITLPIPTYSDETYELDGWYTSPTFEEDTKFESTTIPGENITVYAKWDLKEYKVTWNNADGTEIYSENVTYGTLPEYDTETYGIPTKEQTDAAIAYEFIGWDKEIANVTEDVTYTAQFKEIIPEYNITYYFNNSYPIYDLVPETYTYGVETTIPAYEEAGYEFGGWYTSGTFEEDTKIEKISSTTYGDITLYAKMTAKQYTLTFEENGGSEVENITQGYETDIELPIPTYSDEHYMFEGWYTSPTFEEGTKFESLIMPGEDMTLYAKWTQQQYTIEFNSNGGSEVESITDVYGATVTKPVDPTLEGYEFGGWYIDETLETPFEFTTMPDEDITVYAKWNIGKYTITFETNGGSEIEPIEAEYESVVTAPVEPTKTGNVFDGWYADENFETLYEFTTMPAENVTVYAKWYTNEYTITFNSLGGTEVESITDVYGATITAPTEPTKEGYDFKGWYTDAEFTTPYEFTTMPAEDMMLYAKWTAGVYTISWVNPDGTVIYQEERKYGEIPSYDEETYGIPTYNKTGYTTVFKNWDKEPEEIKTDQTYTAIYDETANTYNITYYNGEVKLEGLEPSTYTYEVGTELPVYEVEHYTFGGWYTSPTFEEETKVEKITETDYDDKTLYAKLTINQYTITFDSNEGSEVEAITGDYGTVVTAPTEPTKEGHTFAGWYSDETLENLYEFTTIPGENITVYAKWDINQYTITFEENDGSEVEDITADYNTTITKPVDPTKEHYTFDNWYVDAEFTTPYEFTTMPAENITLYAKWNVNQYKVTWNNIDGTEIYSEELDYGTLPEYDTETYGTPTFTKDGYTYTFKGWDPEIVELAGETTYTATYDELVNTYNITYYNGEVKLEGLEPSSYVYGIGTELPTIEEVGYTFGGWYTSPTFESETKVEKITETDLEDKVLYAQLTINQYTITFEENGGSEVEDITADYNSTVTKPVDPILEGYTFDNWYIDAEFTTPYEFTTMPNEDVTVYAKWNINEYTITFEENGGSEVEDITADYNTIVTKPVDPTKEHYTFDNWYVDAEFTTPYEFTTMPAENITLYAKWNVNQYRVTWNNIDGTEIYSEELDYGILPEYDTETYGTPTFAKDGYTYTFKGWDPEVSELTSETTYTATYEEVANTYNITYYNGEVKLEGLEPSSYVYGIGTELPTYEMNGYTFEGWYSDETLETKVEKITETDLEDKVLYAKMVRNEFTIYFETNGGTTIEPIKQTAGESITAPTEPTKVGYVFDDWYTDETLETPFEFNVMPENDITLYAKWNEIQIEIVNKEIELFVDEEQQININTIPEGATLTFTYTPTDNIVSVSETGLIKGLTAGETTVTVKVTENPNIEETITVKVNSKEIESETYSVEQKEDVKILIGMDEGVTIETLLNSLTNKSDYLNVYDKEGNKITDHTQVVSTGLKIKLEKEDKVYDEVTTIVRGDVNEDGIINITDKLTLVNHIVAKEEIADYRIYACELEIDGIINVSDKLKLVEYIVQKIPTLN